MADTKKMMMEWLDTDGKPMNTKGSQVIAETTGETFDGHSANTVKHLTATEKGYLTAVNAAGGVVTLDASGLVPLAKLPKDVKESRVVDDITARDALETYESLLVWVKDASADATVGKGAAQYIYDGTAWALMAKADNLVIVHKWSEIEDKPITDAELVDAATKKHAHANAASLDKLTVDAAGLKVDGVGVGGIAILANASDTPVFNGKVRMVVTEYTPPAQA